jgi:hypothetical protein
LLDDCFIRKGPADFMSSDPKDLLEEAKLKKLEESLCCENFNSFLGNGCVRRVFE